VCAAGAGLDPKWRVHAERRSDHSQFVTRGRTATKGTRTISTRNRGEKIIKLFLFLFFFLLSVLSPNQRTLKAMCSSAHACYSLLIFFLFKFSDEVLLCSSISSVVPCCVCWCFSFTIAFPLLFVLPSTPRLFKLFRFLSVCASSPHHKSHMKWNYE